MSRRGKLVRIDENFAKNLGKKYPDDEFPGVRLKTKQLNKVLEEMLYGKKK